MYHMLSRKMQRLWSQCHCVCFACKHGFELSVLGKCVLNNRLTSGLPCAKSTMNWMVFARVALMCSDLTMKHVWWATAETLMWIAPVQVLMDFVWLVSMDSLRRLASAKESVLCVMEPISITVNVWDASRAMFWCKENARFQTQTILQFLIKTASNFPISQESSAKHVTQDSFLKTGFALSPILCVRQVTYYWCLWVILHGLWPLKWIMYWSETNCCHQKLC